MSNRNEYVEACKEVVERVLVPGQTLVQYVRSKKGQARGVVVAFRNPRSGEVSIGWSLCNTKAEKFDKTIGLNKAIARSTPLTYWTSMTGTSETENVPHTVQNVYNRVGERARKFFKVN